MSEETSVDMKVEKTVDEEHREEHNEECNEKEAVNASDLRTDDVACVPENVSSSGTNGKIDYYATARTLRSYSRVQSACGGAVVFLIVSVMLFPLFGELMGPLGKEQLRTLIFALYALAGVVMITIVAMLVRSRYLVRELMRLTGCTRAFDSGKPPIPEQVADLLARAGYKWYWLEFSRLKQFQKPPRHPDLNQAGPKTKPRNDATIPGETSAGFAFFPPRAWSVKSCSTAFVVILFGAVVFLLLNFALVYLAFQSPGSKLRRTQSQTVRGMRMCAEGMDTFKEKQRRYPAALSELFTNDKNALLTEEACAKLYEAFTLRQQDTPDDGWGRGFYYRSDGRKWELVSYGNDGLPGGIGIDADLVWNDLMNDDERKGFAPLFMERYKPTFRQTVCNREFQSSAVITVLSLVMMSLIVLGTSVKERKSIGIGEVLGMMVVSLMVIAIHAWVLALETGH